MAVSGSYNFVLDRVSLIDEAYSLAGIKDVTETLTAEETFDAVRSLNIVMKSLSLQGHRVFLFSDFVAFPKIGSSSLLFPGCDFSLAKDFAKSTVFLPVSIGETSATLVSSAGFAIGNRIGLFDGTVFEWKTITNIVGNVVTFSVAASKAYSVDSKVYGFKPLSYKLLKIEECTTRSGDDSRIGMNRITQKDWSRYSVPGSAGIPTNYFYRASHSSAELFFYPRVDREDVYFEIIGVNPFDDMDDANQNPSIPNELYDSLVYSLAARLAFKYGYISNSERLETKAELLKPDIEAWDTTHSSVELMLPEGFF